MSSHENLQHLRDAIAAVPVARQLVAQTKAPRRFRSQAVDDLVCILEFNKAVLSWNFAGTALCTLGGVHVSDFELLDDSQKRWVMDAPDRRLPVAEDQLVEAADHLGLRYRRVSNAEIYDGYRLRNARDLLRYRGHVVPLDDRMRLMAALDEHGTMEFGDCLQAIRGTQPVPALASLIMQGLLDLDLDDALIGPETTVRRIRA